MLPARSLLLLLTVIQLGRASVKDVLVVASAIDELKQQQKAESKEFHDQLSDKIDAGFEQLGKNIGEIVEQFNATHDVNILKTARDNFVKQLTESIQKIKKAKDDLKKEQKEEWDSAMKEVKEAADLLVNARKELEKAAAPSPKSLSEAVARIQGAPSWETASWLLLALCLLLAIAIGGICLKSSTLIKSSQYQSV